MQLTCPRCHHVLEFSTDRPSFCGYCGSALAETKALNPVDPEAPTLAPDPAAARNEPTPEVVGGYRLLRVLGGGGMGTVYEARDEASGRRVALKLISQQYAGSPDAVRRFRQEGRLASAIAHPRCVFVLAAEEEAGRPYIVMELMPGSTLEDWVDKDGPLPPEKAIAAILDVIEGLEEAHRHGVIHRDVKPSNCFLDADGRVKVGDFGLSKSLVGNARLTRTGAFLGTPLYASPEQIKGEQLDPQTDVYSVAATLYFLLTGRAPFQSSDMAATLARIVSDPAPPMRSLRPDLDPRLDQVVLRGLERDRSRRWRDLAEFRAAVREFLPGRLSIGGLGLRFGAYAIDWFVLFLVKNVAGLVVIALLSTGYTGYAMRVENDPAGWALQLVGVPPLVLYFALLEGIWGASLGKLLLRLRVRRVSEGSAPGLARGFLRAGAWAALFDLNNLLIVICVVPFLPENALTNPTSPQVAMRYGLLLSGLMFGGFVVGVGLALLPMRRRNGYRGLHEFLSGTRVVLLPPAERRATLQGEGFEPAPRPAQDQPERLGPFVVRGVLGGGAGTTVLAARDTSLGRDVWVWLRPGDKPPLDEARRQLSRATRLRWLACGTHGEAQWDALIAPAGSPLAEVVRHKGKFGWPQVCPLMESLTDELVESVTDGTAPDPLRLEQVWVQPNGAVLLLDMPWGDEPGEEVSAAEASGDEPAEAAERRALALLGRVAVLALEGAPGRPAPPRPIREEEILALGRPGAGPLPAAPIRAPLPRYAAEMLRRLLAGRGTCAQFQAALRKAHDRPTEVTRARRAAQVGVLMAFVFVGAGCCMFPAGWLIDMMAGMIQVSRISEREKALRAIDEAAPLSLAGSFVGGGPACWPALAQLRADAQLRQRLRQRIDDDERRAEAQLQVLSRITGQQVVMAKKMEQDKAAVMEKDPRRQAQTAFWGQRYRKEAEKALAGEVVPPEAGAVFRGTALAAVLIWPVLWVVWAFLVRGGISYRIAEIDLVRADGRPAWRLQCAWRALLVWAPLTGLLLVSLALQMQFWADWIRGEERVWMHALAAALWYAALALVVIYVALALARPARSLHDRLTGTYLVPR